MHEMKMKRCPHLIFLLFLSHFAIWSLCPCASAQVPKLIRYQGTLTDTNNVPLEGPHALTFRLYGAETGGQALWTETQPAVSVSRGVFNVLLGQVTALALPFDKDYWLTTQVGTDAEMSPRQRLTSVPYAIRAEEAERLAEQPPHFAVDAGGTLTNNLIAYWKLNEPSGSRADSKGTNSLADHNTVTQAAGKKGNAAQFTDVNSEYLSIADNADVSAGDVDITWAAWFYFDTTSDRMGLITKGSDTGSREYQIAVQRSGGIDRFAFEPRKADNLGDGALDATSFGAIPTGQWIFLVAWHNATADTINIQVNNGPVDSASYTFGIRDSTLPFHLGAQSTPGYFYNGRMDEVAIWKRVLTVQERADLYNNGVGNTYLPRGFYLESSLTGKRYRLVTEELP